MFKCIQLNQHTMPVNRFAINIILMLVIASSFVAISCNTDTTITIAHNSATPQNVAPSFSLKLTNGDTFNYLNTSEVTPPLFLFFFSPYCGTCRTELNELKALQPLYENDITFIAIDIDTGADLEELRVFANDQGYPWQIGISSRKLLREFRILTQSTKVAIDRHGVIIYRGGFAEGNIDEWTSIFKTLSS